MKTKEQIEARIENLRQENHKAGEEMNTVTIAHVELIQGEMYARNNQIIALQWVLE